jgi:hypothetical protein
MSDTQFHETRMGRTFYEVTMPKLVEQLERLNRNLERIAAGLESEDADAPRKPCTDRGNEHRE